MGCCGAILQHSIPKTPKYEGGPKSNDTMKQERFLQHSNFTGLKCVVVAEFNQVSSRALE